MAGTGKISSEKFKNYVQGRFGKQRPEVVVPPSAGVDAGAVKIDDHRVMVVAEDPIFPAPGLPLETFGWFTVHIGASDIAVMGVEPQYMSYSLLMPPGTDNEDLDTIIKSIHEAAEEINITIMGGHTGYYPSVTVPIIGGVTVFSIADQHEIITPAGAQPGDAVIMTKGPAVEAAALLSIVYKERLYRNLPKESVDRAIALHRQISCVKDALVSRKHGVTAMHDATEGGVIGGMLEIASASSVGAIIYENKMVFPEEIKQVCNNLEINPLEAISEGTLLATVPPSNTDNLLWELNKNGIAASVIGEILEDASVRKIVLNNGRNQDLVMPQSDPFWPVFFAGLDQD